MAVRVICFDIGGVLAHVTYFWADAMRYAGFEPSVDPAARLESCPSFEPYQAGSLTDDEYFAGLGEYLGLDPRDARKVHNHILIEPTAGTLPIVESLNASGFLTACLSNTNNPHWEELTSERFPNIARLQVKAASQLFGVSKPDAEIYRKFEALVGARPEEIVFFEDTRPNLDAATALGWHGEYVDPKASQEQQIKAALERHGVLLPA